MNKEELEEIHIGEHICYGFKKDKTLIERHLLHNSKWSGRFELFDGTLKRAKFSDKTLEEIMNEMIKQEIKLGRREKTRDKILCFTHRGIYNKCSLNVFGEYDIRVSCQCTLVENEEKWEVFK